MMLLPVRDAQGNRARPLLWKHWYSDGESQNVATITGNSSLGHCILSIEAHKSFDDRQASTNKVSLDYDISSIV